MKKIILVVILIGMVFVAFYLYQKNKSGTPNNTTDNTSSITFKDFFPFSKPKNSDSVDNAPTPVPDFNIEDNDTAPIKKLKKIYTEPVAGMAIITKEIPIEPKPEKAPYTYTVEYLRIVERENGNLSEIDLVDYKAKKITDVAIPKVGEAMFGQNGATVIMRYLNDENDSIRTYVANLKENTLVDNNSFDYIPYKLEGTFLPDDIKTIAISPSTNKLFYLFNWNGMMLGNILDLKTNKKIQNMETTFHNWLAQFSGEDSVVLTTKSSAWSNGYAYNIASGSTWTKLIGNMYGLTTNVNNNGTALLFSSFSNRGLVLSVLDTKNGVTVRAPANTLSEKCTWANDNQTFFCAVPDSVPTGEYPDFWYQGLVSFTDTMWEINLNGNGSVLEALPGIDATNITVNRDKSKLFFINNKDKSVWELDI